MAIGAGLSVTFSEALDPTTINASSVYLTNGGTTVPTTVSYDAGNNSVTLAHRPLAYSTTYTIVVVGRKRRQGHERQRLAQHGGQFVHDRRRAGHDDHQQPVEHERHAFDRRQRRQPGDRSGGEVHSQQQRLYHRHSLLQEREANTGTHTGSLWTADGQPLATATFSGEGASGWQTVLFSSPVAITAGATYVAGYHSNSGHYAVSRSYFSAPYTSGPLTVPAGGGVYSYGTGGLPTHSFQGSNYWVDVIFSSTTPVDTTPPAITGFNPGTGATGVATGANLSVTFSEALDPNSINASTVYLTQRRRATVPTTVSYNAANNTVTLAPTGA